MINHFSQISAMSQRWNVLLVVSAKYIECSAKNLIEKSSKLKLSLYLLFEKEYRLFILLFLSVLLSWMLFIYFFSTSELIEFFKQTKIIINISGYLLGLEYPQPFSEGSTRFTKALLAIILCGVFLINFLFNKANYARYDIKIILIDRTNPLPINIKFLFIQHKY